MRRLYTQIVSIVWIMLVALGCWVLWGMAQQGKGLAPLPNPAYQHVLDTLERLTPGERIGVFLATDKDTYQIGEPYEARFVVSQESYVVLMRIATNGTISFVLPSSQHPDLKIQPETVYSTGALEDVADDALAAYDLGLSLVADALPGTEVLNLFCSSEPLALFDLNLSRDSAYTIRPDDNVRLQALLSQLEKLSQQEWTGTSVTFLVQPAQLSPSKGTSGAPQETPSFVEKSPSFAAQQAQKMLPRKFGALPPVGGTGTTGKGRFFPPIGATGTTGKGRFFPPIGATGTTGKTETQESP